MIEFEQTEGGSDYSLLLNGELLSNVSADKSVKRGLWGIYVSNKESGQKLTELKLSDFPPLEYLHLSEWIDLDGFVIGLYISPNYETNQLSVDASFYVNLKKWASPFTLVDYQFNFEKNWGLQKEYYSEVILYDDDDNPPISLDLFFPIDNKPLSETLDLVKNILIKSHFNTKNILISKGNSIISYFSFPEDLKVYCEQYLLYFAQFLQDIGINSTTNLKEEAGKVLFSVTPTDDIEALDKIREALALYLNLPSSLIIYNDSFAMMRLQQQIENLQHSQRMKEREIRTSFNELRLAQTVIEHQDKIILQKDSIIEQQNKVIEKITSKSIMMDSLENKEELEEIYDGLKIGESKFLKEQLGIHFNPAKVIKTGVNNLFGKGDEIISILDTSEETEKKS